MTYFTQVTLHFLQGLDHVNVDAFSSFNLIEFTSPEADRAKYSEQG